MAEPFARPGGNATYKNLIALKEGVPVGQWRDSNDGLGGGRYPYDVNTALMPAALRAISNLARTTPINKGDEWGEIAQKRAEVWETLTLDFFNVELQPKDLLRVLSIQQQLTTYSAKFRRMRQDPGSKNTEGVEHFQAHLERTNSMKICYCRQ